MSTKKAKKTNPLHERYGRSKETRERVVWDAADQSLVYRLVVAVSAAGCAVLFGNTRDGGTYALTFFDDGQKFPEYCPHPDDLGEWLLDQVDFWEGYADEKNSPNGV